MNLPSNLPKKTFISLFAALLSFVLVGVAHAEVLLTIVESESIPGQVTITATGGIPSASVDAYLIAYGVDLIGFFGQNVTPPSDPGFPVIGSSTLTTGDVVGGPIFTQATSDDISLQDVDLNLFHNNSNDTISFQAGSPPTGKAAFLGSITLNLSGTILPPLKTNGENTEGEIYSGFSGSSHTDIGQWEVVSSLSVPEPPAWLLLLGCTGALIFWRLRARVA